MDTDTLSQLRAGRLTGIRRLDLSCGLSEFPQEIFQLADSLEILNLSGNALSQLPADLHRLHRLQAIFCSDNRFTELPVTLGACKNLDMVGFKANRIAHVPAASLPERLRWLILTDNQIAELPDELGRRPLLQKLMLVGNRLRGLPASLAACHRLELLRIAANRLDALPSWLGTLPRLSWLAYAGNPFCEAWESAAAAPGEIATVDWSRLTLLRQLGEGASGVIHQAELCQDDDCRPVAVKMFKGAVTSDGLPSSEMAACMGAGTHPGLVGIAGLVAHHPLRSQGLVMRLVDPTYRVLAGPPSLQSCTRDVYADGLRFTPMSALALATSIAAATAHLHGRGILHGDLYGHNILWKENGDALLGDFGAASFFDVADHGRASALQQMEARAFGCLLEELLDRVQTPAGPGFKAMADLRTRCLSHEIRSRPSFAEIHERLAESGMP